jgi:formylglycine-generating enzyme required for sulfatase activity
MPTSNDIHASGEGSVAASSITHSTVVTGDLHLHSGLTFEQLMQIIAALERAYATGQAVARGNLADDLLEVTAPNVPLTRITKEIADDLRRIAAQQADETSYLVALCANPRYGRWAKQFVPLAGMLTTFEPPPDIPPEFWLLEIQREGGARQVQRTKLENVADALARHDTLVLLGAPGAGKTTTLQKLALDEASRRLAGLPARLPLLLPLSDFGADYRTPLEFVQAHWRRARGAADLNAALERHDLLLLMDALNEMPFRDDREYRAKINAWREFITTYAGNQILFTCRSRDYSEKLGLHEVEIEKLDEGRIRDFLAKYVPDQAEAAWQKLERSPLLDLVSNPYYLSILAYLIKARAAFPANRAELFAGFVAHRLHFESAKHADWEGDAALCEALSALAESLQPLGESPRLARQAMQARVPTQVELPSGVVTLSPPKVIAHAIDATLLDVEMQDEIEYVRFYHHQLQEYFAARALLKRWRAGENVTARWQTPRLQEEMPDPGTLGEWEPLPPPPATRWEEPTIVATGLCQNPHALVDAVRAVNPVLAARCLTESGIAIPDDVKKQTQDTLLREMSDLRVHLRYRIAAGDALGNLDDPRLQALEVDGTRILLPPFVEIPAGKFKMGTGSWEAFQLVRRGWTWVTNELPHHTVDVPTFYIAQFPVTNAEYACFIRAGGYHNENYWRTEAARQWRRGEGESGALKEYMQIWQAIKQNPKLLEQLRRAGVAARQVSGWEQVAQMSEEEVRTFFGKTFTERRRDQPAFWDDVTANNPAQPVVGITWYEAMAYCAWLTEKLKGKSEKFKVWRSGKVDFILPSSSFILRLPTEAEWEKAARGTRGWKYPWGNQWGAARANTDESHTLRTTPVGIYPNGATPEGVFDLAGNVWEWCQTKWTENYQNYTEDNDPEGDSARVVRGGSGNLEFFVRCAFRFRVNPDDWSGNRGVRVVLSPISDSGLW